MTSAEGQASNIAKIPRWDLVGITAVFILAVMIANPFGNFPLNDDWSFALTVQRLLETGRYEPYGWASMPLISNVILGWLFCLPLGFSFDALRLSTLSVALIGLLYLYWLILNLTQSRKLAICSALTLALGPIYFALSNTFMTDVPFTTFLIISAFHLWRYLTYRQDRDLYIGTIASLISTLSRQLGLAVPIAFALTLAWMDYRRGMISIKGILRACLPAMISITALKMFEAWLRANNIMPDLYTLKTEELLKNLESFSQVKKLVYTNSFIFLTYLGCFLLPILVIAASKLEKAVRGQFVICFFGSFGLVMALWRYSYASKAIRSVFMPYTENVLELSGIGPLTLRDVAFMYRMNVVGLPTYVWIAITLMAIIGGSMLLGFAILRVYLGCFSSASDSHTKGSSAFFWLASIVYVIPLLLAQVYDRYFIPAIPLVTAAILSQPQLTGRLKLARPITGTCIAWLLVISFAVFSVSSTHDYLAWNRARWNAINTLDQDPLTLSQRMDGGFEFNGFYGYDPKYKPASTLSWWWVKSDELMMSFGPVPGWKTLRSFPYPHYLPSKYGAIYVLEKPNPK